MENATYHVGWQVFTADNDMEDSHIHQGVEEYIYFMGADPMNIFDFDAEIEFFFGDDPDHLESKIITKPTVVRIPANTWHCPILFRNVKKPLIFQAAFLSGTWGTINKSKELKPPAGSLFGNEAIYTYNGDNVRMCRFNKQKRCNICGKCFPKPEEYIKEA